MRPYRRLLYGLSGTLFNAFYDLDLDNRVLIPHYHHRSSSYLPMKTREYRISNSIEKYKRYFKGG